MPSLFVSPGALPSRKILLNGTIYSLFQSILFLSQPGVCATNITLPELVRTRFRRRPVNCPTSSFSRDISINYVDFHHDTDNVIL